MLTSKSVLILVGVFLLFFSACSTKIFSGYALWATQPTPVIWKQYKTWVFVLFDNNHQISQSVTVKFTDQEAKTYIGGDWRRVEIVSVSPVTPSTNVDHQIKVSVPAYLLKGRALLFVLTADACDNYYTLRGQLTDQGVQGFYAWEGLGIRDTELPFYAVPIPE